MPVCFFVCSVSFKAHVSAFWYVFESAPTPHVETLIVGQVSTNCFDVFSDLRELRAEGPIYGKSKNAGYDKITNLRELSVLKLQFLYKSKKCFLFHFQVCANSARNKKTKNTHKQNTHFMFFLFLTNPIPTFRCYRNLRELLAQGCRIFKSSKICVLMICFKSARTPRTAEQTFEQIKSSGKQPKQKQIGATQHKQTKQHNKETQPPTAKHKTTLSGIDP